MNQKNQWLFEAPLTLEVKDEDAPDPQQSQKSLDAILRALQLNPVGGYVKGSLARKQLEEAFESVPLTSALELAKQLEEGKTPLGNLFRYRLHHITQVIMLSILVRKAKELQQQQKKELDLAQERQKKRNEQIEQIRKNLCSSYKQEVGLVEELCRRAGKDSVACQESRSKVREANEENMRAGIRCQ